MKPRKLFLFIIIIVLFSAGCKPSQAKLTASDAGKTVEIKSGSEFVIELEGNPSTGYSWEAKDLDAGLYQQVGGAEFKSAKPGLIGSGGILTLTFKALKPGTGTLTLVYHRPWETNVAPLSTFTVTVKAK